MKAIPVVAAAGLLALAACDRIENDPDIQEAGTAIKGAINDEGEGLKQVYNEARATKDTNEAADDVGP